MPGGPSEKDTCRDVVLPTLLATGWQEEQIAPQVRIRNRKGLRSGRTERSRDDGFADYVLEVVPGLPVGVVEAKRAYSSPGDGIGQAVEYAHALEVPLAYATNGAGVRLRDLAAGTEVDVPGYLTPAEAWARYVEVNGLTDQAILGLRQPFNRDLLNADGSVKQPRYYQTAAIHRVLRALFRGERRLLLLMATGTGKTFTALQIVAKLRTYWQATEPTRNHRVLYLADRDWLVSQPEGQFARAFGRDPVHRLSGSRNTSREVYFATYQALDHGGASDEADRLFREFPSDFFDLVIVDECHRGSASEDSNWRKILDHFAPAAQLGLTATPKRDVNIDTYDYFGDPLYEYTLRQGIDDGYLAPYRIRRVVLDVDADGWRPAPAQLDDFGREIPDREYRLSDFERTLVLPERTRVVARHLAGIFRQDPRARAIVFCVDADHADRMRQELVNAAPDLTSADPEWVVRIVAKEPRAREYLSKFCDVERDSPVIATTSRMLSTGVDVEDLRYVVVVRGVGSMVEFKQIVGRGTRLCPEKGKTSFEIIDYVGATDHFRDPTFDGFPATIARTGVDGDGVETPTPDEDDGSFGTEPAAVNVAEPDPGFEAGGSGTLGPDTDAGDGPAGGGHGDPEPTLRYQVSGVFVERVAEGFYVHDRAGEVPRLVSFAEYAGEQVRQLTPDVDGLRQAWSSGPRRKEIIEELRIRGVDLAELEREMSLTGADAFDVLVRVAWRLTPESRAERARRVRDGEVGGLAAFSAPAREVLEALLDRYAEYGIDEISSTAGLEMPPVKDLGAPPELAARFAGVQGLREAMKDLQVWLYSA